MWKRRERDLDRELRSHLESEAADRISEGAGTEDARLAAHRAFGNPTLVHEQIRESWGYAWAGRVAQDLRYALRTMARSPGFTAVAVVALALGIGANTTIFSVVEGVLLRPLPFHEPQRLMMLDEKWLPRFPHFEATPMDFLAWRKQSKSFEQIAAFDDAAFNLTGEDRPERIFGARVSANLASLLGIPPLLGRDFTEDEDVAGRDRVVLLSYGLWQRRYGGDPSVVGRTVRLNSLDFTIVGVMPPNFRFPHEADIWKPMGFTPKDLTGSHFVWGIGRLRPGVTQAQSQAEMDLIMPRLQQPQVWSVNVVPAMDYYVGEARPALYILLGAAAFVLLIGCVNVANLLLARGTARQREISLRASLGASRGRIVQQLLTESLLLSVAGGALGLLMAYAGLSALKRFSVAAIPRIDQIGLNYAVLAFTSGLSAATGLLFGLFPALRLANRNLRQVSGTRIAGASLRGGVRSALVIAEIGLALVLLTGSGLLLKSFRRQLSVQPGFRADKVLTLAMNLPAARYREPIQQTQFVDRLLDTLGRLQQVREVSVTTGLPLAGTADAGVLIDGRPIGAPDSGAPCNYYAVTPAYFQAMGIPLLRGRLFTTHDNAASLPVVLINETMAKHLFANEDPIGQHVDISGPTYLREIVGVVGDVKQAGVKRPTPPQIYEPFAQKPTRSFSLVVHTRGDASQLAETARRAVLSVDRDQPVAAVRTMEELVDRSLSQDRFATLLLGLFASLALVLAAVGIYGVISYLAAQRTQEIGVRMALGARPLGILWLMLGQSLRAIFVGAAVGLGVSLALGRLMAGLLYDVKANDPTVLFAASVAIALVAMAASVVPAVRAARVDAVVALRHE